MICMPHFPVFDREQCSRSLILLCCSSSSSWPDSDIFYFSLMYKDIRLQSNLPIQILPIPSKLPILMLPNTNSTINTKYQFLRYYQFSQFLKTTNSYIVHNATNSPKVTVSTNTPIIYDKEIRFQSNLPI